MTIKIRLTYVIIALIAVLTASFWLGGIKPRRETDRLSKTLYELNSQLSDTISTYRITVNGQTQTIAEQKSLILSQQEAIRFHILDKDKLKAINIKQVRENIRLKTRINILKDSLEMIKPEIIYVVDADSDSIPHLRLPHSLSYEDDYMFLGVDIFPNDWYFNMAMDMDIDITVGERKTGLFRTKPYVVTSFDNPYVGKVKVQSLQVKEQPLFYERGWFKALTHGAAFGLGFWLGGR